MTLRDLFHETSLGQKIFLAALPLAVLPMLLFAYVSDHQARDLRLQQVDAQLEAVIRHLTARATETYRLADKSLRGELSAFRYLVVERGEPEVVDGELVLVGSDGLVSLRNDHRLVDQLRQMTGSRATIFQRIGDEAVRISTNVLTPEGQRAIGTTVSRPVFEAVIERGETYFGSADVVGTLYLTAYEPLRDPAGRIIGILFVGVEESALFQGLQQEIEATRLGRTGHIHVLNDAGQPLFRSLADEAASFEPQRLERVMTLRDSAGTKPRRLVDTQSGREVVTWFAYAPDLGWTVVAHAYPDEFLAPLDGMRTTLRAVIIGLIWVSVIVAMIIGRSLSRSAGDLVSASRLLETGQLEEADRRVDALADLTHDQDEFVQVANALRRAIHATREREAEVESSEARLAALLASASDGIHVLDRAGNVVECSPSFAEMLGYTLEEARQLQVAQWEASMPVDHLERIIEELLAQPGTFESVHRRKDGSTFDVEVNVRRVQIDGAPHLYASARDISERKRADAALRAERQRLESIAAATDVGILALDERGDIDYLSPRFTELFGYSRKDFEDREALIQRSGFDDTSRRVLRGFLCSPVVRRTPAPDSLHLEVRLRHRDGRMRNVRLTVDEGPGGFIATFNDISDQVLKQESILYQSQHDVLTGLPNRALLTERVEWHLRQARRGRWLVCVAFLDLDGFKEVNDSQGHAAGDLVLKVTAQRLKRALREVDTVARLGGDEFAIVITEVTSRPECVPLFNRILSSVSAPIAYQEHTLKVTGSLGVSFLAQDRSIDGDQLLRQADKAMYDAKVAGKNRFAIFDADQDRTLREFNRSLDDIGAGLARDEFVLHYQPKVNMRTGEVVGAEALLRWKTASGEMLQPDAFLPVVFDHELSHSLGTWVLRHAIGDIDRLLENGISLPVSINVFPKQLVDRDFVGELRQILNTYANVAPSLVELEIVETAALNDLDRARGVMEGCRKLGVACSLDDFGTGFSSLSHLKHLPATTLKIDRSFVDGMLTDAGDLAIVEGSLSLARAFDQAVIAEGVETVEQGLRLLELGCDLAQGYQIAKPMALEDLLAWLAVWHLPPEWAEWGRRATGQFEASEGLRMRKNSA